MIKPIMPIGLDDTAAQGDMDNMSLAALPGAAGSGITPVGGGLSLSNSPFEAIFSKAVNALEGVSQSEFKANDLIDKYIQGKADLQEVMVATSKMNIMVQLAVTTISSAVTSFQQLTQMQM